jgi:glycosyltransferase involved in cell wall biosynthesis
VAYFGFINASKGVANLLRALKLARADGADIRLVMIGGRTGASDASNQHTVDATDMLIEELGFKVGNEIQITSFIGNELVSAHLRACDALALPYVDGVSYRRGSLLAGLAHGCPIMTTTPTIPLPELRDGRNVILVPPEDPESLAAAILRLRADPALRNTLSAGAKELSQRFTWPAIAAETANFFEAVRKKP